MIIHDRPNKSSNLKKSRSLDSNILLVGMPGCGKSSIASILAAFLGFGVFSLDQWITESTGYLPEKIITTQGLEYFRSIEHKALGSIINIKNHVIDLGGGSVSTSKLYLKAKSLGLMIWIDTSIDIIAERIISNTQELDKRPLLSKCAKIEDLQQKKQCLKNTLNSLFTEREKIYQRSDLIVNANFSNSTDIANRIIKLIH
jgi:shikimate kinase